MSDVKQTKASNNNANAVVKPSKAKKTYSPKPTEVVREWYLIDASDAPLGRVSTKVATLLTGKNKPMFSHHIDCGDNVVVINSANLVVTGSKLSNKKYYRHSQYPGSLKTTTLEDKLKANPNEVIYLAVKGMLPINKLTNDRLKRLKIYSGLEHNHEAQKPKKVSIK